LYRLALTASDISAEWAEKSGAESGGARSGSHYRELQRSELD
jgi:hypothetical protein